jgi:sigma-B regulation protein RsbU (phosphoserine phosphatase)
MTAKLFLDRRFSAKSAELRSIRKSVRRSAEDGGICGQALEDVVLAVDEACQNIIRHAYGSESDGEIEIRIERASDELRIWLRDFAPSVDPECLENDRSLDEVRPGGLGTVFIRNLMDEAEFVPQPDGAGNLLRMMKRVD